MTRRTGIVISAKSTAVALQSHGIDKPRLWQTPKYVYVGSVKILKKNLKIILHPC